MALVEDVVVRTDRRGSGAGSALRATLPPGCRARGILCLQLLADRSNTSTLDLYQRRGWQSTQFMAWRRYPEV